METLAARLKTNLQNIIAHCAGKKDSKKTLTDFTDKELTEEALNSIEDLLDIL
jgi:fengycin family lipopeptide synthetase A